MSAQPNPGQRTCQLCGNTVPPAALYCPSCGARQSAAPEAESQSFEDAIASVLGEESGNAPPAPQSESTYAPPFEPVSASPPAPQSWTTPSQGQPSGWATDFPPAPPATSARNRTLWIVLSIFGFITFCCCGTVFLSVAVA